MPEVIVYFANWNLDSKAADRGGEVCGLPWDRVTYINHAFWGLEPLDGETSFQRRARGAAARTEFRIVSMDPQSDQGACGMSRLDPELPRNHFAQYRVLTARYPRVRVMLSIGGWARCGFFSEMAYTPEGRASFIEGCLALLRQEPWLGGIDLDWEYPAGSLRGERQPDGSIDQGCPIWGTAEEDRENFTALLRELRAALDQAFGPGEKKLTACASGAIEDTLLCQDWEAASGFLDFVNIMTYDLAGVWDGVAGYATSAVKAKKAALHLMERGLPREKLCTGSPLYGTVFLLKHPVPSPLGAPVETVRPDTDAMDQGLLRRMAAHEGWVDGYDPEQDAAYFYDGDRLFVSYESRRSLTRKLEDIRGLGLGGIIVWEASLDDTGYPMISQMYRQLLG